MSRMPSAAAMLTRLGRPRCKTVDSLAHVGAPAGRPHPLFAGGAVSVMSLRSALSSARRVFAMWPELTPVRVDGVGMAAGRAVERN